MKLDTFVALALALFVCLIIGAAEYQKHRGAFDDSVLAAPPAEELIMEEYSYSVEETKSNIKKVSSKKVLPKAIIDGKIVPVNVIHAKTGKFESVLIYISKKHLDAQIGIATYRTAKNHGFVTITPEKDNVYISGIPNNVLNAAKSITIQLTSDTTIVITK
ncbi:MAG: hypothetical protein ACRC3J_05795 [Culicoidibacterales bacterium]